jgi:hypothetical protein
MEIGLQPSEDRTVLRLKMKLGRERFETVPYTRQTGILLEAIRMETGAGMRNLSVTEVKLIR